MAPPTSEQPTPSTEREEIETLLVETIRSLHTRIQAEADTTLDADAERLQLERIRTLAHVTSQYRLLARDADVDEMDAELDLLADVIEWQEGS
ncbi:hypothetical protein HUG10_07445 [Halorarum halophilum]|uniref:DUF8136 domain-containing protein n=1 Tax=Halorarum halophilum TaxID=2743090 RepID=A0A7D5GHB1_9EURY|nr:hypothetical protein [Halobaculum halophilum]QLG27391.1 hypothetical protein HUG10_07445 [Halobaculum halophilum]